MTPPAVAWAASKLDASVLVVDDDAAVATVLSAQLEQAGARAFEASSAAQALALLERRPIDLVVSDLKMPGMDGFELLRLIRAEWPEVPVIMLTAHGSVPLAVEAMKAGASDFMLKPFEREEILFCIEKALRLGRAGASEPPERARNDELLLGESPPMRAFRERLRRAAESSVTVLLQGETGTGKELAARMLHQQSSRNDRSFVKLSCAALPESLLESELFGYEKGAFTGAVRRKPGRVELAQGGSLFLDEIGDVPLATQVKLLRVLQEKEVERLGGRDTLKVDVRFIAATHRRLDRMVELGTFREDLFYRLNVVVLELPPLRERPGDVELLARRFLAEFCAKSGKPSLDVSADAIALLAAQPWPGNVRQLENFMERLIVFCDGPTIGARDVRRELAGPGAGRASELAAGPNENVNPADELGLGAARRQTERDAIVRALERAGNNRSLAARLLGISRRTLYNKLEELGL